MSDNIHIKLPDGSDKEMPKGSTALDVAKSISPRLSDAVIAVRQVQAAFNSVILSEIIVREATTTKSKDPESLGAGNSSSGNSHRSSCILGIPLRP